MFTNVWGSMQHFSKNDKLESPRMIILGLQYDHSVTTRAYFRVRESGMVAVQVPYGSQVLLLTSRIKMSMNLCIIDFEPSDANRGQLKKRLKPYIV